MYFMSLFHYRTVFDHPVLKELLHDIQLTPGVRYSILSLKSIPQCFASWQPDIRIHQVITENTNDQASKEDISLIERTPFLWRELFRLTLFHMDHSRQCSPHYTPLVPTY